MNQVLFSSVAFLSWAGIVHAQVSTPAAAPAPAGPVVNVRDVGAKGDGTTDDAPAINRAIVQAIHSGPNASVYFPAGNYYLPTKTLSVPNASTITLYGDGPATVLTAKNAGADMIKAVGCKDLTVRKMTLDRSDDSFIQGQVESMSPDRRSVHVMIEPGYPDYNAPQMAAARDFKPFTYPESGTYQLDRANPSITSREKVGDREWILHLDREADSASVGKEYITWAAPRGIGVVAVDDGTVLLEDITYQGRGANAGYYIANITGNVTLRRFHIDVPPGSHDLIASGGGGQLANVRGKLVFDHCRFLKFDDDGADVLTNYVRILSQPDPQTLVLQSNAFFHAGDTLAIVNWPIKTERGTVHIVQVKDHPDRSCTVSLDAPVTVGKTGPGVGPLMGRAQIADGIDRVTDYSNVTSSTEFTDCEFQCLRARPLNLKAQNCTIDGCKFYDCQLPAVAGGPEFYWTEAPALHHFTVRNCQFTNCETSNIDVDLFNADTGVNGGVPCESYDNRDILIEGNTFTNYGAHRSVFANVVGCAVHVRYATNVTIRNNTFGDPAPTAPSGVPKVLVQHCRNVVIQGNIGLPDSAVRQE